MTSGRSPRSRIYDGWLYANVFDRLFGRLHSLVARLVEPGQRVLDVGCGTGDLARRLAPAATEVVGIDLSPAMVAYATQRRDREGPAHLSFLLGDAVTVLRERQEGSFDVAVMLMVLHEIPPRQRAPVLQAVARVARRILCVDFRVPQPLRWAGVRNRLYEVAAGREHFSAYLDYQRRGGIPGIARAAGLGYEHQRFVDDQTLEVGYLRRTAVAAG